MMMMMVRLDVEGACLLAVHGHSDAANLFLDRRQDRYDGRQGLLVLGHHPSDVLDVVPGLVLLAGVRLDVLKPHVEQFQGPLDGVDLRKRDQLNVPLAAPTAAAAAAGSLVTVTRARCRREGTPGAGLASRDTRSEGRPSAEIVTAAAALRGGLGGGIGPVGRRSGDRSTVGGCQVVRIQADRRSVTGLVEFRIAV